MNVIFNTYNNKTLMDAGSYMSDEAKKFARDFKRRLSLNAKKRGMEVVNFNTGHYYFSGFVKKDDKYVYFSYDIPRWEEPIDLHASGCSKGFLVRTAENEKDYHGGHNNFTNLIHFMDKVEELLR